MRNLIQGEMHSTAQAAQVIPAGGCHWAVPAFSPGIDWLSQGIGSNVLRAGVPSHQLRSFAPALSKGSTRTACYASQLRPLGKGEQLPLAQSKLLKQALSFAQVYNSLL